MKNIICVKKNYKYRGGIFTFGKSYNVLVETDTHYLICDDISSRIWIFKNKEEINFTEETSKYNRKLKLQKLNEYYMCK